METTQTLIDGHVYLLKGLFGAFTFNGLYFERIGDGLKMPAHHKATPTGKTLEQWEK